MFDYRLSQDELQNVLTRPYQPADVISSHHS